MTIPTDHISANKPPKTPTHVSLPIPRPSPTISVTARFAVPLHCCRRRAPA